MPTKWVPPEEVLTETGPHGPVTVYHVYKSDDMGQGRRVFIFTTSEVEGEDEAFDVRDLAASLTLPATIRDQVNAGDPDAIRQALRAAVRAGLIPQRE